MAIARVVTFEGVTGDRIEQLRRDVGEQEPPADIPAREILMLHNADTEKAVVIVFFDSREDYARGDAALNAMPADDTPGRRTSVGAYEVALRRTM